MNREFNTSSKQARNLRRYRSSGHRPGTGLDRRPVPALRRRSATGERKAHQRRAALSGFCHERATAGHLDMAAWTVKSGRVSAHSGVRCAAK